MNDVYDFLSNNINIIQNDYIVLGLSGGPDSMALLNILLDFRIKNKVNYNIVCVHINHNIRIESNNEEKFIKEYCKEKNVTLEVTKFEYTSKFTESLGHKMRYEYFDKIMKKYNAKYLLTAHHGDDLIETILMKIVRGSNLSGYLGFENILYLEDYTILRPLVFLSKEEILEYNKINRIPFVIDNSNFDDKYTRNRYRKYVLPFLKNEDHNVHLKFLKYSNDISEYNEIIKYEVNRLYTKIVKENILYLNELKSVPHIVKKNIIYKWLNNNYNEQGIINSTHVDIIINVIDSSKPNLFIDLPNKKIVKEYNKLYFDNSNNIINYKIELKDSIKLYNNKIIKYVKKSSDTSNNTIYINSNDVKLPLYVRNYHQGDIMSIKNFNGHKKIKDIFINEKIPLSERKNYPVVVDSDDKIIWLPGIKKSLFDSQNDKKYDIILEYH